MCAWYILCINLYIDLIMNISFEKIRFQKLSRKFCVCINDKWVNKYGWNELAIGLICNV